MARAYTTLLLLLLIFHSLQCQPLQPEKLNGNKVWIDPALDVSNNSQTVVVWFDTQLLGHSDSYQNRSKAFAGQKRSELSAKVVQTLKTISTKSFAYVQSDLEQLESDGHLSQLVPHWIVNGFSCTVDQTALEAITKMTGVSKVFLKQPAFNSSNSAIGPIYLETLPQNQFAKDKASSSQWNIKQMRAQEVWTTLGVNGAGSLNVVHDFGFKLDVPPLAENLYTNHKEIPGNGIDDDQNGFVDDYHGYNFDQGTAVLNQPRVRGQIIHGNICAGVISGGLATDTKEVVGLAPKSKWAPVIGSSNIEQAVEWAIEQGADTYSMSFSQPNLGEFRSHWRKVMEHGAFCGVVFISGAGNFASDRNFAPIPVQMRNPEDIPEAVLGVAGVGKDGIRPVFSSQGPVSWQTEHYKDGNVGKPDFATFNFQVPCLDLKGRVKTAANGNSLAGPHMAGIVALMLSANPELMPWDVKAILKKTAKDIGSPGFDYQSGYGLVNAYDAVKAAVTWNK
ncbi:MAG: S8 family serine peptidase [Bacteroidota bacterium]